MSEVTEERMDHLESKLDNVNDVVTKISRGLFGDESFDDHGIIYRISTLEKQVSSLKGTHDAHEIGETTRRAVTDDWIIWLRRAFWGMAVIGTVYLLLTGKIGFADLFK